MGKGAKGKSSATSATRKKHAKKHVAPEDNPQNIKKVKKDRGKKKDKEPRKKVYIPPIKPAPVQPDPLETSGLAHTLPPDLLVILRSFNKKAQVTKIRALEELNSGWVEKAINEGEDGLVGYTLVEMLPVWMHHLPALFIHPSRRLRSLAAGIHLSFLRIPPVREQFVFFLRETASPSQVEQIIGSWSMAAHDVDRNVASTALKAWDEAFGEEPGQIQTDETIRASSFEFLQQTSLDPEGIYLQLNPVQPSVSASPSQPQSRKGSGRSTPVRPTKRGDDPDMIIRNKMDESEESGQDKRARLRIGALGALGWLVKNTTTLSEPLLSLFSNPAFLTCLHPTNNPPWIDMEAFGYSQPAVRKTMWILVHSLLLGHKEHLSSSVPALSRAMLRSAWVERDPMVQASLWHPLLTFLNAFPSAWEVASTPDSEDKEESDSEDGSEDEDEEPKPAEASASPASPPVYAPYDEFLQFLRAGCGGSPLQGYPTVVIAVASVPATILFKPSFSGLEDFFSAFWEALDSRALSSLNRSNAAAAFSSSLLESMGFLVRRLVSFSSADEDGPSKEVIESKASEIVQSQIQKIWQELADGKLRVEEMLLAQHFSKTLGYLQRVKPELYEEAWATIRSTTAAVSKSHPSIVATFLKGLYEGNGQLLQEGAQDSLLTELSNNALVAYEAENADEKRRQLLPDLLNRFQGELFKDSSFTERLDSLLKEKTSVILESNSSLVISILTFWKDEAKATQLWERILRHLASGPSQQRWSILSITLEAIKQSRLAAYLKPPSDIFDNVVSQLFTDVLAQPSDPTQSAVLKGLLQYHSYFMTDAGFSSLFASIASSLKFQITHIFDGNDRLPLTGMNVLLDLTFSTYKSAVEALSSVGGLDTLMTQVFLYGRVLPLCHGDVVDNSFALAKDLWNAWYSSEATLDGHRAAALDSIKEQLKSFILDTSNRRVSPRVVLDLLTSGNREFEKIDVLDFFPSDKELGAMLSEMSSRAIDPSMAVVDPLIAPFSAKASPSSSSSNDQNGYSSYARGVFALLQFFSTNRTFAKKNLWALRHFLALSIYAHDFQSMPGVSSPAFDERVLGVAGSVALSEVTAKIDQMTTYLLLSGDSGGEAWRRYAVDALLFEKEKELAKARGNSLSRFLVQVVNEAKQSDSPRETRILRAVLDHVLEDLATEDGDLWIQLSKKVERNAPETAVSIIYAVAEAGLESPKLDRYRNEVAASLLGIRPQKVNSEGLLALRKLAAAAPDPESDVIFLPQLRAVNVVKTCQKWVEGGNEGEDDEDEGEGVDEDIENAMLPVFASLAPILQNDHGKHWDFIFDLVETILENSSVSKDETLVGLVRALKMVVVIEDLCATNKGLRAEWEPRRTNILTMIRDLAAARLEHTSVSLPRSVCRELLLSIVQSLPASLIDHETLGKMCHLITDPSTDVQKMAYQMLKTAAEQRTEYLVIEVGVGNIGGENAEEVEPESTNEQQEKQKRRKQKDAEKKDNQPRLLPAELMNILQQDVSLAFSGEDEEEQLGQSAFGWMLAWILVFDLFKNASFKVKSMYIEQLRNHDLVGLRLLPNIVSALHLDAGLNKAFKVQLWGVDEFFVEFYEPSTVISIPVLAAHLYYRALLCVPSLVHTWVLDCKDRQLSNAIITMTSQCFSPLIIQAELAHVRSPEGVAELTGDGLTVKVVGSGGSAGGNDVVAAYVVDEHQLEIRLKIPSDWPLHRIEVKDEKRVGVDENRWRAWVLAVQQTIWTHNGRIVDGLSLFKKNVTLHFEGQVECAICYSIISVMDGSLPKKPCKTCKNRFHAGCLYKWFNTSHSSTCPLCRSNII